MSCECDQLGCTAQISVSIGVYARTLATPSAFLVVAGHEDPTREHVITAHGRYVIVEAEHDH